MTSVNPVFYGTAKSPTSASTRKVIDSVLLNDAALEAFCIDYFPWIKQRFSSGMERRVKVTLLLEQEDRGLVLAALQECCPHEMGKHGHLIRYDCSREGPLSFSPPQDNTQQIRPGFSAWLSELFDSHGSLIMWLLLVGFYFLFAIYQWASYRLH